MSDSMPQLSSSRECYAPLELRIMRPPKPRRLWLYALFFLLTVLTTLVVGARFEYNFQHNLAAFGANDDTLGLFPYQWSLAHPAHLVLGIPFAATLMLILFAHEMGHYLYCRYYGVYATLPFFVPFPNLFGTLGAFIRIKSPIRSRSALFDIGVAGPIAGFIFASIALVVGLAISKPAPRVSSLVESQLELGYPLIFRLVARILNGASSGASLAHLNLHPVAIAAWVGMFATAMNLLPGGQLDGGHITFAISPRLHRIVSSLTIVVLIGLAFRWIGWLVWALLVGLSGLRHPVVPQQPGISFHRRWVAIFGLLMLVLTFTSTPLRFSGSESLPNLRDLLFQLWQWVHRRA